MGLRLGRVDGASVGLSCGWSVGLFIGMGKGASVGITVGLGEGTNVGITVGLRVGEVWLINEGWRLVGSSVGPVVGLLIGLADGGEVMGLFVIDRDGAVVGFSVKVASGARVGTGKALGRVGFIVAILEGNWFDSEGGPALLLGVSEGVMLGVSTMTALTFLSPPSSFAIEFELARNAPVLCASFCSNIPIDTLTALTSNKRMEPNMSSLTSRGADENQLQHP